MAKEARHCDTLVPAFRSDPRCRRGRDQSLLTSSFPQDVQEKRICLHLASSLSGKGEIISFLGGRKLPPPFSIMTEQRANHEHSLLNHTQPQEWHKETSAPLSCSMVRPQQLKLTLSETPSYNLLVSALQGDFTQIAASGSCLTRGTSLSSYTLRKALRAREKHREGLDAITVPTKWVLPIESPSWEPLECLWRCLWMLLLTTSILWLSNLFASFLRGPEGTSANGKRAQAGGQGGADRWPSLQQRGLYLSSCYEVILGKITSTEQGTTSSFFSAAEPVFSGCLSLVSFCKARSSSYYTPFTQQFHLTFSPLDSLPLRTIPLQCDSAARVAPELW